MAVRETPTFNVKAVSKETGVKPDTLRAWERRYGMPQPGRSPGGHRLYSGKDVETVKWLVARQEEGLSISNAVDLWHQLRESGEDPLTLPSYAVSKTAGQAQLKGETLESIRDGWIDACLEYDERSADDLLNQAFAIYPIETVVLDILRPAMSEIGTRWYAGSVAVQQEHFASELAIRRLESLIDATAPASRRERLLLVCPPKETHTFPLLVLALLLRRRGWPVVLLGANVPLGQLQSALDTAKPSLAIATAQLFITAATLREMSALLEEARVPLAYGGLAFLQFPELRGKIAGQYLGDAIGQAPGAVENLIAHPQRPPTPEPVPEAQLEVLEAYRAGRVAIEQRLMKASPSIEQQEPTLAEINTFLGDGIEAGLSLGDLSLLRRDLSWVETLITNHHGQQDSLATYLAAYAAAVEAEMGPNSMAINSVLEGLTGG